MEIKLPDGTVITNVPKEVALALIKAQIKTASPKKGTQNTCTICKEKYVGKTKGGKVCFKADCFRVIKSRYARRWYKRNKNKIKARITILPPVVEEVPVHEYSHKQEQHD